ncbi:MAG: hypothetical protein JXA99_06555 [Candidatus Lokiarchaeota archaeon]|nr:hypothetical protein [Candidatus Lokiarchaeota archaeon]
MFYFWFLGLRSLGSAFIQHYHAASNFENYIAIVTEFCGVVIGFLSLFLYIKTNKVERKSKLLNASLILSVLGIMFSLVSV